MRPIAWILGVLLLVASVPARSDCVDPNVVTGWVRAGSPYHCALSERGIIRGGEDPVLLDLPQLNHPFWPGNALPVRAVVG